MADSQSRRSAAAHADERIETILRAAGSWAAEAPDELSRPVRAVCIRLAEMVADQRHYLAPLPEPQDSERQEMLALVAARLGKPPVTRGLEQELAELSDLELKSTGSWAVVPAAQAEWVNTAIRFLEDRIHALTGEKPDQYWAEDVVAGLIASVRALLGVEELHARADATHPGTGRDSAPVKMEEDPE